MVLSAYVMMMTCSSHDAGLDMDRQTLLKLLQVHALITDDIR